jgi:hypothetical protein
MAMKDTTAQSFSSASDVTKQIITLATGVLTLMIAFKDKIMPAPSSPRQFWLFFLALLCHLLSICGGIWALYGITNILASADPDLGDPSVLSPEIRRPAGFQISSFILGLLFLCIYAGSG